MPYRDRRRASRDFRLPLDLPRINAAARPEWPQAYSRLIGGLKRAECAAGRKMLAPGWLVAEIPPALSASCRWPHANALIHTMNPRPPWTCSLPQALPDWTLSRPVVALLC